MTKRTRGLRLDAELTDLVQNEAVRENRTFSNMVMHLLKLGLAERKKRFMVQNSHNDELGDDARRASQGTAEAGE